MFIYYHAECCYAECHFAECRYAECHGACICPVNNMNLLLSLIYQECKLKKKQIMGKRISSVSLSSLMLLEFDR
jgi:hypothetical protein